jgi:hypothetical protein
MGTDSPRADRLASDILSLLGGFGLRHHTVPIFTYRYFGIPVDSGVLVRVA